MPPVRSLLRETERATGDKPRRDVGRVALAYWNQLRNAQRPNSVRSNDMTNQSPDVDLFRSSHVVDDDFISELGRREIPPKVDLRSLRSRF